MERWHDIRGLGHRRDDIVGEVARMRAGEANPLETVDCAARTQELAECLTVAELNAVGVHVLAEQRDLQDPLGDECLDLGENLTGPAVLLRAPQCRDDAEGARVVAPDAHRHPGGIRRVALRRQRRREGLERLLDLDLGLVHHARTLEEDGQGSDVVGAEHDIDDRGLLQDHALVLLGKAAADRDLHARVLGLHRDEMAEIAVELVVGVLADRAGVEHDDIGDGAINGRNETSGLQQPRESLGVVDVHLAAVRAHLIRAGG